MSQRGLEALLRPKSIAVIGASMKPQRAGYLMMRNLLAGGFNGPAAHGQYVSLVQAAHAGDADS